MFINATGDDGADFIPTNAFLINSGEEIPKAKYDPSEKGVVFGGLKIHTDFFEMKSKKYNRSNRPKCRATRLVKDHSSAVMSGTALRGRRRGAPRGAFISRLWA